MLFNSIDFVIFLPIVFILYWFVFQKKLNSQNTLIALSSYLFYGWWDWRFLSLIIFSSVVDYVIGLELHKTNKILKRKLLLWLSIIVNLGFLGFFKYFNFFISNFVEAFSFFGFKISSTSLNIILPVGISFYTFQTLSYTIDVYRKQLKPTKNFIAFTAFVSFFPQLVAGPIERASNLLPQFYTKRKFDYSNAILGLRQILWGLFKKIVIADNCAKLANEYFNNYTDYGGLTLLMGAIFFAFQIYGDFSGYSDMAIGIAKLFGFKLMKNFAFPYFSRDIAEFWRRWHISLSTWFRDYLYIPLGGSRGSKIKQIRNVFIIFIVSGFWHGANWTFIIWGALNATFFLPLLLSNKNRNYIGHIAENRNLPKLNELFSILTTFLLTIIAWIFFRAENLNHATSYIYRIFSGLFEYYHIYRLYREIHNIGMILFVLLFFFFIVEWFGRNKDFALEGSFVSNKYGRNLFYYAIIILIFMYTGKPQEFIYFQF